MKSDPKISVNSELVIGDCTINDREQACGHQIQPGIFGPSQNDRQGHERQPEYVIGDAVDRCWEKTHRHPLALRFRMRASDISSSPAVWCDRSAVKRNVQGVVPLR